MQTKEDIYLAWAPEDSIWSRWAKPVLFAFMDKDPPPLSPPLKVDGSDVMLDQSNAIVVDLPGLESIRTALRLARCGYRPVPLFNAYPQLPEQPRTWCSSSTASEFHSVVDMAPVVAGLYYGAQLLKALQLPVAAPPAFVIDSRRHGASGLPSGGMFDNRSAVDITDFPSFSFLAQQGIRRVTLVQENLRLDGDLNSILLEWQAAGIDIYSLSSRMRSAPEKIMIKTPSLIRRLWARFSMALYSKDRYGGFGRAVGSGG